MSGLRSPKSPAGAKAGGGPGSTHQTNAKPLAARGAKASGGTHGVSTHEALSPDRRAKAGAKASGGTYSERVTEHHRK